MMPESNNGEMQSPINIPDFIVRRGNHSAIFEYDEIPSKISVENSALTIDFIDTGYVKFDGVDYILSNIRFVTPAEHLISSVTYPLEIQIEHSSINGKLIFSILFREGRENKFIKPFLPMIKEENDSLALIEKYISVEKLIDEDEKYYFYNGSLTTEPYLENVNWIVFQNIREASYSQIKIINDLQKNNARAIQNLNGRKIEICSGF